MMTEPLGDTVDMALLDQALLANDPTFLLRVRVAAIGAAVSISNESTTTANHPQRDQLAVNVLTQPDNYKVMFAAAIATQSSVINDATQNGTVTLNSTNTPAQGALVTDTDINNAVASVWNSFFNH